MPKPQEVATLIINGTPYRDWTSVMVRREYGAAVSEFQFSCTEGVPFAKDWAAMRIKPGDACTILLAGQLALTGYVYLRQASYDARRHGVMIIGRSLTGDVVDSSAPVNTGEFKNQNWEAIARKMLEQFKVPLMMRGGGAAAMLPFKRADVQPGESVFQFLERLARQRGIVLSDDESGNLVAATQFESSGGDALVEGQNILRATCTISDLALNGPVASFAQINGDDNEHAKRASQIVASTTDTNVSRFRPLVTLAEHPIRTAEAQKRTEFEGGWRESVSIVADITKYGWLKDAGGLWKVGEPVPVKSPMLMLDMTLYTKCVVFTQDVASGTLTTLTLVRENLLTAGTPNLGASNSAMPGDVQPSTTGEPANAQ